MGTVACQKDLQQELDDATQETEEGEDGDEKAKKAKKEKPEEKDKTDEDINGFMLGKWFSDLGTHSFLLWRWIHFSCALSCTSGYELTIIHPTYPLLTSIRISIRLLGKEAKL